jgi:hypothetical protein
MAGLLLLALRYATAFMAAPLVVRLVVLAALLGVGAASYGTALWLLKAPEARALPELLAARLRPWLVRLRPASHS